MIKIFIMINFRVGLNEGVTMKVIRFLSTLLIIVGALNWGLVGFFQYNLVSDLFGGEASMLSRIIFGLVGLAGLYSISYLCKYCRCGSSGDSSCGCGKKDRD